jgi:hypothetical protein
MKTTLKAATILAGLAFSAPAFAANIVETASSAGTFKTLIAAAKAAGLADLLATDHVGDLVTWHDASGAVVFAAFWHARLNASS